MDKELENILDRYANRLAALETETTNHSRICGPRGWTSIILSTLGVILLSIIGFFTARLYSQTDLQSANDLQEQRSLSELSLDVAGIKKEIEEINSKSTETSTRLRLLEDWRLTMQVRDEMSRGIKK